MNITNFTVHEKCSSCGNCCSDVLPMSKREVERIKAYVKEHDIAEQRHNFPVSGCVDMTCPFRDDVNRVCLVYEVRPAICRQFQCDHKPKDIAASKAAFHEKYNVVFMRHTFFGNEEDIRLMQMMMGGMNGTQL